MSLLKELQRRSVFKVGIAYLVVAWLVIQVAATVAPQMGLPEWAPRFITLIVLLGFPVALVLAWIYDVTPEGLKADPAPAGNKRVFAIAAVLAIAALGWYYRGDLPAVRDAEVTPRLAVLPLSNFSPDPANAFFADGLHDDMLTALSRMQGVEVISRTTMQTFKDSKKKLSEIAQEVGATQVLEGSVRRDGTRVRLTVQLIDARTDDHIWAETYDRPLADALTLQNEVAQGVAKAMKVAIEQGADAAPPTQVPAAYDLYLKARLAGAYPDQLKLLDSALVLDPRFSLARAARARAACRVFWFDEAKRAALMPQARADIAQARAEQPGVVAADVAEALYVYYGDTDYSRALEIVDRALAADANDVEAHTVRSNLLRRLGRKDDAVAASQRALALDPASPNAVFQVIDNFRLYGRYREAIAVIDAAASTLPAETLPRFKVERVYLVFMMTGDRAAFLAALEALKGEAPQALWETYWYDNVGPSPATVAHYLSPSDSPIEQLMQAALHADHIGNLASRDQALDRLDRLYAAVDAPSPRPYTRIGDAVRAALRGDRGATIASVDDVLARLQRRKDEVDISSVNYWGAYALARIGEKERALALLEQRLTVGSVPNAGEYHYPYIAKFLGDEPRYQAAMKTISDRFQKP